MLTTDMQQKKEQIKLQIQQELAVAGAQQLINKITENVGLECSGVPARRPRSRQCFAKCIKNPSTSLSSGEERCLTQCMSLYMAAFDQTSKSYVARISKERSGLSA